MTKKKIVSLCLAAVLVVMAIAGATVAYFTDTDAKDNTFTVGNVDITLTEPNWESSGSVDAPDVYPGEPLAKDPTVTNSGKNPCFVRISVANLDQFDNKGDITYRTNYQTGALGADWVLHTDGYFYYTKVLNINESTTALFDQIVMPTGLTGNETTLPITVTAQAVQAQGAKASFSAVQQMTVEEIAAWFTTCGMV
mgnify:FL=1